MTMKPTDEGTTHLTLYWPTHPHVIQIHCEEQEHEHQRHNTNTNHKNKNKNNKNKNNKTNNTNNTSQDAKNDHVPVHKRSFLIGWRLQESLCVLCVVRVTGSESSDDYSSGAYARVQLALQVLNARLRAGDAMPDGCVLNVSDVDAISMIGQLCENVQLSILGTLTDRESTHHAVRPPPSSHPWLDVVIDEPTVLMSPEVPPRVPRLRGVWTCRGARDGGDRNGNDGVDGDEVDVKRDDCTDAVHVWSPACVQVVFYRQPGARSLLSSTPFSFEQEHERAERSDAMLAANARSSRLPVSAFERTLRLINNTAVLCDELRVLIDSASSSLPSSSRPPPHHAPAPSPSSTQSPSLPTRVLYSIVNGVVVTPLHLFFTFLYIFSTWLLWLVGLRIPMALGGARLRDRSKFAHQLDWRAREMMMIPRNWLRHRRSQRVNDRRSAALSIRFSSTIWSIVIDVLSGWVLGFVIYLYTDEIMSLVQSSGQLLHGDVLRAQIIWLMTNPADIKLNAPLTTRLGTFVLNCISYWDELTHAMAPWGPVVLKVLSVLGAFGASIVLSAVSDLISVVTVHLDLLHSAFSRMHGTMLSVLVALGRLFRGKKRNVLRDRVDNCDFDVDQFVVGTLLFTVVFFLFATFAVYYVFFSVVRLLVTLLQAAVWWNIAFFNHFPFYSLGTYVGWRHYLPGGVAFRVLPVPPPLPLSSMSSYATPAHGHSAMTAPHSYLSVIVCLSVLDFIIDE